MAQEYVLFGSVLDSVYTLLLERIKGLADPRSEAFSEHELVFANKSSTGPITWHVRRSLDHPDAPFHLRYVGNPDPDENKKCPTIMRKTMDCLCHSNDMMGFLGNLGFRMQYEFVAKGVIFTKGPIKITVSKIQRVTEAGNATKLEKFSDSYLVEISALAAPMQSYVANSVREFADQLKP
ncbi:mediator of RNA polymerase II transcription [Trichuris trichiura]|uniref:Mediator of RNA polymerase II transcription subunit 18 n=1 Tax=Trichuris trichiura TaxID=36087 RepID=A0A077ZFS9_TRITR|nr:mediator of RNA polymerase II transcription [Trichuris trichiura]